MLNYSSEKKVVHPTFRVIWQSCSAYSLSLKYSRNAILLWAISWSTTSRVQYWRNLRMFLLKLFCAAYMTRRWRSPVSAEVRLNPSRWKEAAAKMASLFLTTAHSRWLITVIILLLQNFPWVVLIRAHISPVHYLIRRLFLFFFL